MTQGTPEVDKELEDAQNKVQSVQEARGAALTVFDAELEEATAAVNLIKARRKLQASHKVRAARAE